MRKLSESVRNGSIVCNQTTLRMNELGCHSAKGKMETVPVTTIHRSAVFHRPLSSSSDRRTARPVNGRYCLVASIAPAAQLARTGWYDMRNVVNESMSTATGSVHPSSSTMKPRGVVSNSTAASFDARPLAE